MNAQFLKDFTQCILPWREKRTCSLNTTYSVKVKHSGGWRFSYSFVLMIIKENIYELCCVASYKICVTYIHKFISYPYDLHRRGIFRICMYVSYLYMSINNMHIHIPGYSWELESVHVSVQNENFYLNLLWPFSWKKEFRSIIKLTCT